jgi:ATP-dependent Clp protease ATP-binding subunit ClpX
MNNNVELGMIVFLDEIQNWFSSMESKNFPPEALEDITQQRKQRKMFVGTSQVFTRVSKPIREQITLLYKPLTVFGCLTVVRVYKCKLDEAGTVKNEMLRKVYFFVHTDEIRQAYDTYERVERLATKGYKPRAEQFSNVKFDMSNLDLPKH